MRSTRKPTNRDKKTSEKKGGTKKDVKGKTEWEDKSKVEKRERRTSKVEKRERRTMMEKEGQEEPSEQHNTEGQRTKESRKSNENENDRDKV